MSEQPKQVGERVRVELGPRSYDVLIVTSGKPNEFGEFAKHSLETSWGGRGSRQALTVVDHNVESFADAYESGLASAGISTRRAVVEPGEASKCLAMVSRLYDELAAMKADRHTVVVALGGGVVGDLAGFVAATYTRGLPLLMVPTTLLSQVDSSVGGKVGVNHPSAKNVIGAFHQPNGVWVDTSTLDALPEREFRCGLAEVVKYGVILDGTFFRELEIEADSILAREPAIIRRIVSHSCRLKADVVSKDEREETGLRAVLNFGHTIGHAVETVAGYRGDVPHGEAVAIGMVAESRLAERLGWIDAGLTERLATLLDRLGLPLKAEGLVPDALIEAMGRDKKNKGGRIRYVLPRELGRVELTDRPREIDLRAVLDLTCRPGA